jgi:hypothetical protein
MAAKRPGVGLGPEERGGRSGHTRRIAGCWQSGVMTVRIGRSAAVAGWRWRGRGIRRPHPADPKYNSLPKERLHTPPEAARNTDIVVLATPWSATEAAVKSLGDLSGKIIIDCTNPLAMGSDGLELVLGHTTSGGEQVAACAASRAPRSSGSGAPIGPVVDATGARPPDYRWGSAQMIRFPRPRQNMRAGPAIARRSGDNLPSPRPV